MPEHDGPTGEEVGSEDITRAARHAEELLTDTPEAGALPGTTAEIAAHEWRELHEPYDAMATELRGEERFLDSNIEAVGAALDGVGQLQTAIEKAIKIKDAVRMAAAQSDIFGLRDMLYTIGEESPDKTETELFREARRRLGESESADESAVTALARAAEYAHEVDIVKARRVFSYGADRLEAPQEMPKSEEREALSEAASGALDRIQEAHAAETDDQADAKELPEEALNISKVLASIDLRPLQEIFEATTDVNQRDINALFRALSTDSMATDESKLVLLRTVRSKLTALDQKSKSRRAALIEVKTLMTSTAQSAEQAEE